MQFQGTIIRSTVISNTVGYSGALCGGGTWVDGNGLSGDSMPVRALAIDVGTGPDKRLLLRGEMANAAWTWVTNGILWVSTTDGILTQTEPPLYYIQKVGWAISPTRIWFDPDLTTLYSSPV